MFHIFHCLIYVVYSLGASIRLFSQHFHQVYGNTYHLFLLIHIFILDICSFGGFTNLMSGHCFI